MFGCFRKGEANDPETYVAAITAVLSRYPEDVIRSVTHPAKGLPIARDFLPTVAEVYRACEDWVQPRREHEARRKTIAKQLAERKDYQPRPVYERDSAEAKAVKVLHDIVGRAPAFAAIFRRPDGSVSWTKEITPQLAALAHASEQPEWVALTYQQAGAWEGLLRPLFDPELSRQRLREGSVAPWPWPPSVEGKIYNPEDGPPVPEMTNEDLDALASEGQR